MDAAVVIAFSGFGADEEFRAVAHAALVRFSERLSAIKKWKFLLKKRENGLYLEAFAVPHTSTAPMKFRAEGHTFEALESQLRGFFGRRFGAV